MPEIVRPARSGSDRAWATTQAEREIRDVVIGRGVDAGCTAMRPTVPDPRGARSYPIVTYTWALVRGDYDSPEKTAAVHDLLRWLLTDGQADAESLYYVPLPENLVQAALAELDALRPQR